MNATLMLVTFDLIACVTVQPINSRYEEEPGRPFTCCSSLIQYSCLTHLSSHLRWSDCIGSLRLPPPQL